MQVTNRIHALKVPFEVPVSPEVKVERHAFVYVILGDGIYLVDSGVAGAEVIIYEYIRKLCRDPEDIAHLILTHSHPDHIGSARAIKEKTGCTVWAHKLEQGWIENVEQQFMERPVPGFHSLVGGSVDVDELVDDGDVVELESGIELRVMHTPGHSRGSVSFGFEQEKALFTGDALIAQGDMPIYEDVSSSLKSITALQKIADIEILLSSWEPPIRGREEIRLRIEESLVYLERIHSTVKKYGARYEQLDVMTLCRDVVNDLGLPPFSINPLVAQAFASSLANEKS